MSLTTRFGRVMMPLQVHRNVLTPSVLSSGQDLYSSLQACGRALQLVAHPFTRSVHSDVLSHGARVSDSPPVLNDSDTRPESFKRKHTLKNSSKLLKVAFIGRPNAGKSTLINQIVGRTVCPISMRAHTTRLKAKSVLNEDDTQIVFLDTPGVVLSEEIKKFKFDQPFLSSGEEAALEADVIGVVYDAANRYQDVGRLDQSTMRMLLMHKNKKTFLVMNKVDAVGKKISLLEMCRNLIGDTKSQKGFALPEGNFDELQVSKLIKSVHSWPHFDEVFMISALEGDGVGDIKEYLLQQAYPGSWLIQSTEVSPFTRQQLAINFLKAAYLDELPAEVPYQLKFHLCYFEEDEELCVVEIAVEAKNRRHESLLFRSLRRVSMHAESNLASALEKACRMRIKINTGKN